MKYIILREKNYLHYSALFPELTLPNFKGRVEYTVWTPTFFPHIETREVDGQRIYRVDLPFTANEFYVAFTRNKNWEYEVYRVETQPALRFASPSDKEIEALWEVIKPSAVLNMYKVLKAYTKSNPLVLTFPVYSLKPVGEEITSEMNLAVAGLNKRADVYDYINLTNKYWFTAYPAPVSEKLWTEKAVLRDAPEVRGFIPVTELFNNELAKQTILALRHNLKSYTWVKGYLLFATKYRLGRGVKWDYDGSRRGTSWLSV
jgi:hypothetical protein